MSFCFHMDRVWQLIFECDSSTHRNAVSSGLDRLLHKVLKLVFVLDAVMLLKARRLESILMSVIVLGILDTLLVDLVDPVVPFSSIESRHL